MKKKLPLTFFPFQTRLYKAPRCSLYSSHVDWFLDLCMFFMCNVGKFGSLEVGKFGAHSRSNTSLVLSKLPVCAHTLIYVRQVWNNSLFVWSYFDGCLNKFVFLSWFTGCWTLVLKKMYHPYLLLWKNLSSLVLDAKPSCFPRHSMKVCLYLQHIAQSPWLNKVPVISKTIGLVQSLILTRYSSLSWGKTKGSRR